MSVWVCVFGRLGFRVWAPFIAQPHASLSLRSLFFNQRISFSHSSHRCAHRYTCTHLRVYVWAEFWSSISFVFFYFFHFWQPGVKSIRGVFSSWLSMKFFFGCSCCCQFRCWSFTVRFQNADTCIDFLLKWNHGKERWQNKWENFEEQKL